MDLVLLCTVPDNFQAEMIVAAMKENNIPVHKRDLGNAGMLNLLRGNSSEGEEIVCAAAGFLQSTGNFTGNGVLVPAFSLAQCCKKGYNKKVWICSF